MNEKISDSLQRNYKINQLRGKIISETDDQLKRIEDALKEYLNNGKPNFEYWKYMVSLDFSLLKLKEFVERDNLFQSYIAKYDDQDLIIYYVSDKNLNIWLQDDYNFAINYLCIVKYDEEFNNIDMILNDKYFGRNFTNIIDEILYDEKHSAKG